MLPLHYGYGAGLVAALGLGREDSLARMSGNYRSTRRRCGAGTDKTGAGKRNRLMKRRAKKGYR